VAEQELAPQPAPGQGSRNFSLAETLLSHSNLVEGQQMEVYDPHKSTTEIRQASSRLGNFWVLIVSMVLVVALFAIIYIVFAANTPPTAN
jgi:hypothetical protein